MKQLNIFILKKLLDEYKQKTGYLAVDLTAKCNRRAKSKKVVFYRNLWTRLDKGILPTVEHLLIIQAVTKIQIFK